MNLNLGDNTKQEIVFGLRVLDEVFGPEDAEIQRKAGLL